MTRRPLLATALLACLTACAPEVPAKSSAAAPAAAPAKADEAAVRAAVKALLPEVEVSGVTAAPIAGFSEAAVEGRVFYVSNDGKYLIQGALVDVAERENLTALSEAGLRRGLLDAVGSDRRIIFAAAQPKHRVTVFTDIDCGYCRRMHDQMAEYNRLGITIEYLFYPRSGVGTESFDKAVAVWCAPDRRAALTAAKGGQELPKGECSNPVAEDYALGRRVGLDGTPAIYAANGQQVGGYLDPAKMLERLDEIAAKAAR